jgi:hypothetical protein
LNLADLDWANELVLTCPINKIGTVTVWQTSRHGALDGAGAPAFLGAIKPRVIVVNNGPKKGLGQGPVPSYAYDKLAALRGVDDIWQGHLSLLAPSRNTGEQMIANMEDTADCKGHWIKASVRADGTFTITNSRNGFSKTYR